MELQLVIENKIRRERLPKPVKDMEDEELNLFIYKEKWTIVCVLSRLDFCDKHRQMLCQKYNQKVTPKNCIDGAIIDLINNAFIPYH